MAWEVAVAGTLHRDDVTTPAGRVESLGGSALYFALAAARHARVRLNAITGADTADAHRLLVEAHAIDLEGMVISATPTFRWRVEHDFVRWVLASESAEEGCDPEWVPSLSRGSRDAEVLFLASLRPELQRDVLAQSRARLIGADSMTVFMAHQAADVMAVAAGSDILFLNAHELGTLTGDPDWRSAATTMCGRGRLRAVVVKQGPHGAACVTRTGVVEVPAHPVAEVIDPTGAGDALAGGFLGVCAALERDDEAVFGDALREGVRCAAAAITAFGPAHLGGAPAV